MARVISIRIESCNDCPYMEVSVAVPGASPVPKCELNRMDLPYRYEMCMGAFFPVVEGPIPSSCELPVAAV